MIWIYRVRQTGQGRISDLPIGTGTIGAPAYRLKDELWRSEVWRIVGSWIPIEFKAVQDERVVWQNFHWKSQEADIGLAMSRVCALVDPCDVLELYPRRAVSAFFTGSLHLFSIVTHAVLMSAWAPRSLFFFNRCAIFSSDYGIQCSTPP